MKIVVIYFLATCTVLSLAVLDPRVGRTVDNLSPLLKLTHLPHGGYYCVKYKANL